MAKQIRSVVRLDDARFANGREDVYSVRLKDGKEFENGFVVTVGDVEDGNRDVREALEPAAGSKIAILANPAVIYDNNTRGSGLERFYYMEGGEVVRAYTPAPTYVFSVTREGIEGGEDAEAGKFVVSDGYKLKIEDVEPVDATGFVGKVVRIDPVGGRASLLVDQKPAEYVVIDTIQNA